MIADCGATFVIVGHSERRTLHQENDATVNAKTRAAWRAGLTAVVCIGETQQQREAGATLEVVGAQLKGSIPDRRNGEPTRCRLRAGLGDRHRSDPDHGRRGGSACIDPVVSARNVGGGR